METEKLIEKLSQEQNESSKVVRIALAYAEFASLVRRMREAQKDVIYKSMFSALDSARPTAYEVAKTKQIVLESEVDEYLKKMVI